MIYTIGMIVQGIFIVVNSGLLLFNYAQYRKYRNFAWVYAGLIAFNVLCLSWCAYWLIYDAGKVSGNW